MVARDDADNDREQRDPFELLAPIARRAPRERERATVKADEDAERISTTKTNARRAETTTEGVKTRADEDDRRCHGARAGAGGDRARGVRGDERGVENVDGTGGGVERTRRDAVDDVGKVRGDGGRRRLGVVR